MTTRRVSLDHYGTRVVRVRTRDHAPACVTRDSVLEAVANGKRLALGLVWNGTSGKAELDMVLDQLEQLATPLTDARIDGTVELEAEGPGVEIDLGMVYDGLQALVRGEQRQGLDALRRVVADARKKRAARANSTRDSRLAPRRTCGDGSTAPTIDSLNQLNREFWANQARLDADPAARTQDSRERNAEKLAEQRAGR